MTSPHEQTALAFAQKRLQQARENDAVLHPPIDIGQPLDELLGQPKTITVNYPTNQQLVALGRIRSVPEFAGRLRLHLHQQFCQDGVIITMNHGAFGDAPCFICQQAQREATFRQQMKAARIDGRYLDVEWHDLDLRAPLDRVAHSCQNIRALVDSGANLLLHGEQTGTGKTQAAMLIGKAALRAGYSVNVRNLARLALEVRNSYGDDEEPMTEKAALLSLTQPDVLILDDLGAGESDSAAVERRLLFLALDDRQMMRKPTICTTNLALRPPDAEGRRNPNRTPSLVEVLGTRVLARLQPLTPLHVDHGINFRTRKSDVSW